MRRNSRERRGRVLAVHLIGRLAPVVRATLVLARAELAADAQPLIKRSLKDRNSTGPSSTEVPLIGQVSTGLPGTDLLAGRAVPAQAVMVTDVRRVPKAVWPGHLPQARASPGQVVRGQAASVQVREIDPIVLTARELGVDRVHRERLHGNRGQMPWGPVNRPLGAGQSQPLALSRAISPNLAIRASLEAAGAGLRAPGLAARGQAARAEAVHREGKSGVSCPELVWTANLSFNVLRAKPGFLSGGYYATGRLLNGK